MKLITAIGPNNMIGRKGGIPWSCPMEHARFLALTAGKTVVMGRKSYDSLRKPLPKRRNIVLTENLGARIHGVDVCHSVEDILDKTASDEEVWVMGGAKAFELLWDNCDEVHVSWIITPPVADADTFFPDVDWAGFSLCSTSIHKDHVYQIFRR